MEMDKTGAIDFESVPLSESLIDNINLIEKFFKDDDTLRIRFIENSFLKGCVVFLDGMTNVRVVNENIVAPLMAFDSFEDEMLIERLYSRVLSVNEAKLTDSVKSIIEGILSGDTAIFVENSFKGIVVNSKGFTIRSISEPDDDKSLQGPREGFTENLMTNTSMLRRKIQSPDLKFSFNSIGTRTNTKYCLCYIESLVNKKVLNTLKNRLNNIKTDGALEVNYLVERIKDGPFSFFKTIGSSEKPDIIASRLLEGRIAIILDGTPVVLSLPYIFTENFQSADDYYLNFYYGSLGRILRIIGFAIALTLPAFYVAVLCYHQEILPSELMLNLSAAIKGTPFPLVLETLGMLLIFEILRETGVRMSNKIGGALSIVGALVLGQSAVEAKIVCAPTIIIVALTCITGLMLPRLKASIIILRLITLGFGAVLGLWGIMLVIIALILYLHDLKSFGMDYTSQLLGFQNKQDAFLRLPLPFQKKRPHKMAEDIERL